MNPASGYRLQAPGMGNLCVSVSLWLVISIGFSTNGLAQDTSVEQLVATALERSPEIRAARTAVTTAGGEATQAALMRLMAGVAA